MRIVRWFILLASVSLVSAQIVHQPVGNAPPRPLPGAGGFNLDFEDSFGGAPALWSFVNGNTNEYLEALDTSVSYSGTQSLRISSTTAPTTDKAYAYQDFPVSLLKGQTLHVSGAIRTQNNNSFATLFAQVNTAAASTVVNLEPDAPSGSTGWGIHTISATLPAGVTDVLIGVTIHGSGTAWFDQLSIDVDGVPLSLPIASPTPGQIGWLQQNATPFTTLEPGVDDAELAPLNNVIGNARIVGLGEGTHGTSEFFRMKSRIISYLARNLGFTIFAIEGNMPEAYKMNDYVLNGNDDPKDCLPECTSGPGTRRRFWTW